MDEKRPGKDFWEERYRDQHTPWDLGEASEPVKALVRGHFPPGGAVFLPGCGRGYEALHLARLGYRVTAVDWVAEPVRFLREAAAREGLEVEVLRQDMFALPESFAGRFDVFLEQTCLCALAPAQWPDYEALAFRLLRPAGRLLGVFMELEGEDGPPFDCPPEKVRALLSPPRWTFEGMERIPSNPARPGPEYTARFTRSAV